MRNRSMKLATLLPAFLIAACSTTPSHYADQSPKMDFITYFTGTTYGYGAIYSRTGKVTDRFKIVVQGTPGTNAQGQRTLRMAEDFTYTSGKTQQREWSVTQPSASVIHGKAVDVPGTAVGEQSGNAIKLTYPITIERESGSKITLSAEDWMWMMPDNTLLNRNALSKFGINVAELVIYFTKQAPAKSR
ncbi:MAG: hypothetical protein DI585_00820 [Pseudomonas fluorescens]|nr:MAG: hypothetical protein DI585_00820 [Pseudomonas fluorescens]